MNSYLEIQAVKRLKESMKRVKSPFLGSADELAKEWEKIDQAIPKTEQEIKGQNKLYEIITNSENDNLFIREWSRQLSLPRVLVY
jgi:hypothetical protein